MHKRALGAVAISGVAGLLLSGCGGSEPPAASTPTATDTATSTAAAPTTTQTGAPVRDPNAQLVIWTDVDRLPIVQKYANAFGQENGITVTVQSSIDLRKDFKDATNVGKGPDVVVGAHDWLGELVSNNTLAPVQLSADLAAKFTPNSIPATKFNGQGYGVPISVENIALMRNTDLAPNAPATMAALVAQGNKVKSESGGKVTNVLIQQVGKTGNAYYSYPYLSAYGGGIFAVTPSGEYDGTKLIVNSPESLKGAAQLAALGKAKVLTTNIGDDNAQSLFDSGKSPFFFTGPWSIPNVQKAGLKYAISPLPSLPGGDNMKPFLGIQMFMVSAKAKNPTFAQEFVTNYISRKDVQIDFFKLGGRAPALLEAYNEVATEGSDVKAFGDAGEGALPMPNIPAMNAVWGPLGQAAADVISQKSKPVDRFNAAQKEIATNIAKS